MRLHSGPLAFLLAAAAATSGFAQKGAPAAPNVTPAQLVKDGAKYNGKRVRVVGKVSKMVAKKSRAGRPYFTLVLTDGASSVNVYGHGVATGVKDGAKVAAVGTFSALKKMRSFEVKNEVDVSGPAPAKKGAPESKPTITPVH